MKIRLSALFALIFLGLAIPGSAPAEQSITKQPFGKTADGEKVDLYTLTNASGMEVTITNYGATIVSLCVPDRDGNTADVVLGLKTFEEYLAGHPYLGSIVGRYANRIAHGKFRLHGKEYELATNNGENHLHGGEIGFDKVVWKTKTVLDDTGPGLVMTYLSKDGEEGYPGNLTVQVSYVVTEDNGLQIDYHATTDQDTPVNLTSHPYFNLVGEGNGDILGHQLTINADEFTPVDENFAVTGEIRSVEGTPLDFRKQTSIGRRINRQDEQLRFGKGYDHNYVLNQLNNEISFISLAARVVEPTTGRVMEVLTTEPGLQFYSGNFLDGSKIGKGKKPYEHRYGFCLETQHFPDSPNQPAFPSTILKPGDVYQSTTIYRFSTE